VWRGSVTEELVFGFDDREENRGLDQIRGQDMD